MKAQREEDNPVELLDDINRTGIMLNPEMAAELIIGAEKSAPHTSDGDNGEVSSERADYLQEGALIGSYPAIIDGNGTEANGGDSGSAVLLDKLGERLAFERQGTRLYEAFSQKVEAMPSSNADAPTSQDIRHIWEEEREHFELLQEAIVKLGGDATVQTPSADVAGVLSHGVLQIMSDPRTTLAQSLQAALTAELCDNDGWQMLKDLADQAGYSDLAKRCGKALEEEGEHLANVRTWLSKLVLTEASGAIDSETMGEDSDADETGTRATRRKKAGSRAKRKSTSRKKRKK